MSKHGRVYSEYQLDIGAGAFKRALVTHQNAVNNAVKRISRTSERSGKEKAEMLKEDLERKVTLCLHNSFCRNRESNVDPVPCCKQRVEEQSQYHRRKRWNIDEWQKKRDAKRDEIKSI